MKDFIIKLYEYENFPIYLGSIIFVLVVAFFVVFFLGKKDQKKIEKTQKLEKINADAFKEVSAPSNVQIEAAKEETNNLEKEETIQENQDLKQNKEEKSYDSSYIEAPNFVSEAPNRPKNYTVPVIAPPVIDAQVKLEQPAVFEEKTEVEATLNEEFKENENNLVENDSNNEESMVSSKQISEPAYNYNYGRFDDLAASIANELNELEKQQEIAKPLLDEAKEPETTNLSVSEENIYKVASFDEEPITEPEKKATIVNDVFSSVYAPKKEEPIIEDTMAIELPKLKNEAVLKEEEETKLNI